MKWFEGSIPAAINTAKQNKSLFIVYISDDKDLSKEMSETWESEAVSSLCQENNFVSLQLDLNSEGCVQFSQIYPVVCVPCTFFIGNNGVPLEVIGGAVKVDEFVTKVKRVVQIHEEQLSSEAEVPAAVPTAVPPQSQPSTSANQNAVNVLTETSSDTNPDLNEKLAKAQELMEKKRLEKAQKEKEDAKKSEMERRKLGQQMANFKQWKAEKEQNDLKAQMKKDKEDEKKARERVKAQIAKDKEERAARFHKEKEEREAKKQTQLAEKMAAQKEAEAQAAAARSEFARIQFRLPDGSSVTNQFSSSQSLDTARNFIKEKVGSTFGQFSLSTLYPKRTFTENDMSQTLLDLQLAPSAVLILLPGSSKSVSPSSGGGGNFILTLLAPFIALWTFLYNFLFGNPRQTQQRPLQSTQIDSDSDSEPVATTTTRSNRPMSAHPRRGRTIGSRQEGNIRRLRTGEDDDDMATWNGNSTQQM